MSEEDIEKLRRVNELAKEALACDEFDIDGIRKATEIMKEINRILDTIIK